VWTVCARSEFSLESGRSFSSDRAGVPATLAARRHLAGKNLEAFYQRPLNSFAGEQHLYADMGERISTLTTSALVGHSHPRVVQAAQAPLRAD